MGNGQKGRRRGRRRRGSFQLKQAVTGREMSVQLLDSGSHMHLAPQCSDLECLVICVLC
jgi:hypothetical protein